MKRKESQLAISKYTAKYSKFVMLEMCILFGWHVTVTFNKLVVPFVANEVSLSPSFREHLCYADERTFTKTILVILYTVV